MQGMQLNLIISIWFLNCAQDFLSFKLLETKLNSISLFDFLNLEFVFSRTRGSAGAIANPYTISYCLSTFYFSKLWKNLTSCAFSCGKTCKKVFRIFCEYRNRENYSILTPFKGLSRLGTWLMVVLLCGMRPHAIRDLETYSMSCWRLTGIDNIMQSYALFFVELNIVRS